MRGLSAFVGGFKCSLRVKDSRIRPGRLRGLLRGVSKASRRPLVDHLALHSVGRTHCAIRGAKRFNLTTSYCYRFASPVHQCPSLRVRQVVGSDLQKHLNRGHVNRCARVLPRITGRTDRVRQHTSRTRQRAVGLGGIRCVRGRVKRAFTNIVSKITRCKFFIRLRGAIRNLMHIASLASSFCRCCRRACRLIKRTAGHEFGLKRRIHIAISGYSQVVQAVSFALTSSSRG